MKCRITRSCHNKYGNGKSRLRTKLRRALMSKFSKCAVSGWINPLEIQMAHIIPKKIGYKIEYLETDSEENCVLLANGLHALFDGFQWTVDIFSCMDYGVESESYFKTLLLMKYKPRPGVSSLSDYVDKHVMLPIQYYPSFYAHYYTYLKVNYLGRDPKQCFAECIKSKSFLDLKKAALLGTSEVKKCIQRFRKKGNDCTHIINHSIDGNKYNLLWHGWSYSYNTWVPFVNISNIMTENYHEFIEHMHDPTYV